MNQPTFLPKKLIQALVVSGLIAPFLAYSQTTDLGAVGTQSGEGSSTSNTASKVAPTQSSLDATQPKSIINKSFFEDAKGSGTDFFAIAAISPSVSGGYNANGPGLGESKATLRGFKDGEYNITFDGIPFGDTNGPTHHSTAYFPSALLESVIVERGPGNASNLGQATYGGSINLYSITPAAEFGFAPYISMGSFGTTYAGFRLDSGNIGSEEHTTRLAMVVQDMHSEGAQTNSPVGGYNYSFKLEHALSANTLLTLFSSSNDNYYYQSDNIKGLTLAQAAMYGTNYNLSRDSRTRSDYFEYMRTEKNTQTRYLGIVSDLGDGWKIDNKTYYQHYANNTLTSDDKDVGLLAGGLPLATKAYALAASGNPNTQGTAITGSISGYTKLNEYWSTGNIFKAIKSFESGTLTTGLWIEKSDTHRNTYQINLLSGGDSYAPSYSIAAPSGVTTTPSNIKYEQGSGWMNYQPFAEFEWKATKDLSITPGLKFMRTDLNITASVNQTDRIAQTIDRSFQATLPFLTANYKLDSSSSVYAQYAQGMLVPNISQFYYTNANSINVDPARTTNYQVGYVSKTGNLVYDIDAYYITVNNKVIADPSVPASYNQFINQGQVTYQGFEGQATYAIGNGISAYGNFSFNSAKASSNNNIQINAVPEFIGTLALLYKNDGYNGAAIARYVGQQYADDSHVIPIDPFTVVDLSAGYTWQNLGFGVKSMKVNLGIYNMFDRKDIYSASGSTVVAAYNSYLPGRSYMVTLKTQF
jgi:iron complex outermembrane receptor protein